jgi:hypothetical protein
MFYHCLYFTFLKYAITFIFIMYIFTIYILYYFLVYIFRFYNNNLIFCSNSYSTYQLYVLMNSLCILNSGKEMLLCLTFFAAYSLTTFHY